MFDGNPTAISLLGEDLYSAGVEVKRRCKGLVADSAYLAANKVLPSALLVAQKSYQSRRVLCRAVA